MKDKKPASRVAARPPKRTPKPPQAKAPAAKAERRTSTSKRGGTTAGGTKRPAEKLKTSRPKLAKLKAGGRKASLSLKPKKSKPEAIQARPVSKLKATAGLAKKRHPGAKSKAASALKRPLAHKAALRPKAAGKPKIVSKGKPATKAKAAIKLSALNKARDKKPGRPLGPATTSPKLRVAPKALPKAKKKLVAEKKPMGLAKKRDKQAVPAAIKRRLDGGKPAKTTKGTKGKALVPKHRTPTAAAVAVPTGKKKKKLLLGRVSKGLVLDGGSRDGRPLRKLARHEEPAPKLRLKKKKKGRKLGAVSTPAAEAGPSRKEGLRKLKGKKKHLAGQAVPRAEVATTRQREESEGGLPRKKKLKVAKDGQERLKPRDEAEAPVASKVPKKRRLDAPTADPRGVAAHAEDPGVRVKKKQKKNGEAAVAQPAKAKQAEPVPPARRSVPKAPLSKERVEGRRSSSPPPQSKGEVRLSPLREPPARLVSLPLPIIQPAKRVTLEERAASIEQRLAAQSEAFRQKYTENLDMSWIYHDSALEGVVYTFDELRNGLALVGQTPQVADSTLQPTYEEIRRHKEAIEFVRDFGVKKRLPVTVDLIKKIYLILHPAEGDVKTVKYRKDIPQHRLYFHEYAPPDKVAYKVRQVVEWLSDPETRKTRNTIRIAARAHYDLLRVYPFPSDSGKVSRLFMNVLLMRAGFPPAIIHSTERQRYYEALKGSATTVLQMVQEAVENAMSSIEKLLGEHETKTRAFVS